MGLQTQLNFINIDETGRIITIKDNTGIYDETNNPTGYNPPNPLSTDIQYIVFTISHYNSRLIHKATFARTGDPNDLTVFYNPTVDAIASGTPVDLTSLHFDITSPEAGISAFSDGVLDLNMYTIFNEVTGITGVAGNPYIIGTGLDTIFHSDIESLYINGEFYQINRTLDTNGGTLLYLLQDLKIDTTSFYPAYRSNTKAYNASQSNCLLQAVSGKLALDLGCSKCGQDEDTVFRLMFYKILAQLDFNAADYAETNKKLISAYKASKSLNCNCK